MVVIANFLKIIVSLIIPFQHFCLIRISLLYDTVPTDMYLFFIKKIQCTVQMLFLKHWIKNEKVWVLFLISLFSIGGKEYAQEKSPKFVCFFFFFLQISVFGHCSEVGYRVHKAVFISLKCDLKQKTLIAVVYSWLIFSLPLCPAIFFSPGSLYTFKADAARADYFTLGVLVLV